jgi:hypothetical protein
MPKRTNLKKILFIGSGPIVIGQACELDYRKNGGKKWKKWCRFTLERKDEATLRQASLGKEAKM